MSAASSPPPTQSPLPQSPLPQSPLTIRRVHIDLKGVPFAWHPGRPRLATALNAVSWAAVVFERRLCGVFKEMLPDVHDARLRTECEHFVAQEAMHSRLHGLHVRALVAAHPELGGLLEALEDLAEARLSGLSVMDRLAMGALVEGWLAPLGRYIVAEREQLFAGADVRVASLFLWHFCEEIEHRSTAHKLYRARGGSWWGLMRALPRLVGLQRAGRRIVAERFAGVDGARGGVPEAVWGTALLVLAGRGLGVLLPGHRTGGPAAPDWAVGYLSRVAGGMGPVEAWTGRTAIAKSRSIT